MKTRTAETSRFEFSFPNLDTLASVDRTEDGVVIRMSRDTFSEERKACFVRELASEGFISDDYRWLHSAGGNTPGRVRWLVDPAWWKPSREIEAFTFRFMVRVLGYSALLWLALMVFAFCRTVR
jgi:hypothetical protein